MEESREIRGFHRGWARWYIGGRKDTLLGRRSSVAVVHWAYPDSGCAKATPIRGVELLMLQELLMATSTEHLSKQQSESCFSAWTCVLLGLDTQDMAAHASYNVHLSGQCLAIVRISQTSHTGPPNASRASQENRPGNTAVIGVQDLPAQLVAKSNLHSGFPSSHCNFNQHIERVELAWTYLDFACNACKTPAAGASRVHHRLAVDNRIDFRTIPDRSGLRHLRL